MKTKNIYTVPEMNIIEFDDVDIITTSSEIPESPSSGGGIELPDHEW